MKNNLLYVYIPIDLLKVFPLICHKEAVSIITEETAQNKIDYD